MGSRWAWMGMVGLCALASGCHERDKRSEAPQAQATAPAGQGPTAASASAPEASTPAGTPAAPGAPSGAMNPAPGAQATAPTGTGARPQPPGAPPLRGPDVRTPQQEARAPAPRSRPGTSTGTGTSPGTGTAAPTPEPRRESRVMIGAAAVQARDDEAWYDGAARAAQAAVSDNAPDRPLTQVVIASSVVSGRVTRVGRNILHVRDREGSVYELELDKRSRGLRQGQPVALSTLGEGTPVRAQFVLMGGRTIARDVQVQR